MVWLCAGLIISSCSKKNESYKDLLKGGEIYYPGVVQHTNYRAGNLRTMLVWNPSPDPKIVKYKVFWNNKQDSMIVASTSHNPLDTFKLIVPNLLENTYNFNVYSIDGEGRSSISINISGVRVYGPKYQSGLFNRPYNANKPYLLDILHGNVRLNFNTPDSINVNTVVHFFDNNNKLNSVNLSPDSTGITLSNFKFGTPVTFQSSYIPQSAAIDVFTVADVTTFPAISRAGDVTAVFIKNPGNPFYRSDNGTGKWGLPKDWQVNANAINQNNGTGGGWSTDNGGCIHFEAKNYSDAPLVNGKVSQTITLPAGSYALDIVTAGYGGTINANEVVAKGNALPDIDQLNGNASVLAMYHGDQNSIGGTHTISFTLTQQTTVTIGWVVSEDTYTYLQFKNVALRLLQ
ncbi:DUF4998 domain-containing protein [Mucilaginibacter pocheonensis]|uniref:DUF5013 domain-containing protein n=1 Tax=Mucilaginibacter pocheonensis TaxID=398050 RepID=A0ABU1TEB5_9SPHI|nr:DUF4998 domain-containing protein [Mucilaginibacter pocheonensis]MDR6943746.1 hypothetical protein [Mucilaginibacter pocheonensis]